MTTSELPAVGVANLDKAEGVATPTPIEPSSARLDQLIPSFVDALGELQEVPRSRTANAGTYKYAYADLGDVIAQIRPVFKKHGLTVNHDCCTDDGEVAVRAVVWHKSGQCLVGSPLRLPAGNTAQNVGSALTYARRYTLMAIAGLATEDDDGAGAGTRDTTLISPDNVTRFLQAATDALLTRDEIAEVVLQATEGRTVDPAQVRKGEIPALREALAAAASDHKGGVSQLSGEGDDATLPDRDPSPSPELDLEGDGDG